MITGVTLSSDAARVLTLAQDGDLPAAAALGAQALSRATGSTPAELAGLWYALGVVEHVRGDDGALLAAADRCLALALDAGSPGWASNALTLRSIAHVRAGAIEAAVLDLARAEVELADCDDVALRCWAHTGLGHGYQHLRLYELAEPHLQAAVSLDASPMPLPEAAVIDHMNLAELHLRWADEIERLPGTVDAVDPADAERHRAIAWVEARAALRVGHERGVESFVTLCRWLELCARATSEPERSLPALVAAADEPDLWAPSGGHAQVACALARSLRALGRPGEAVAAARRAVAESAAATDWQVAATAHWLLTDLEAQSGVAGARSGRDYGRLLSQVLWEQRLGTLQSARSAVEVERLRREHGAAVRAAAQDALTGLGNRRALDDALQALTVKDRTVPKPRAAGEPDAHVSRVERRRGQEARHSLLLLDLDGFKAVNDRHGHVVGDEVLRAVGRAMQSAARSSDLVVRLGGDEFVVLAAGTSPAQAARLADRLTAALYRLDWHELAPGLKVRASLGVATTGPGTAAADLLRAADEAMYRIKEATYRIKRDSRA